MTDFIFMVQGTSHMFITGPDVVKTVTGEDVTLEELGGAMSHATKSGRGRLRGPRREVLPRRRPLPAELPALQQPGGGPAGRLRATTPSGSTPELVDLMPASPNQPYDMKKVIEAVVDDGEFFEVNHHWAMNLVCGFARIDGRVGRHRRQPAADAGRRARHRRLGEGGAVRADLRRLQHPPGHLRRRARVHARHRPGVRRASSATGPSCSTPTASRRFPGYRSSPARPTAAPTWS